jgi:hypothetical protein
VPEKKIKFPGPDGRPVDGYEVPVRESTERWSEITLEDGTVLRVKPVVVGAVRLEGQYDPEGNPLYALKQGQNAASVYSCPDHLRKPAGSISKAN